MAKRITGASKGTQQLSKSSQPTIISGRVKYCILNEKENPSIFKQYGEWSSIGTIFYQGISTSNNSKEINSFPTAKPLFPNSKNYPLENEIVFLIPLPNPISQTVSNEVSYYYFQPINIWNSVHHNALPNPSNLTPNQTQDYEQVEGGAIRKVEDGSTEITLGDTFQEKLDVKNVQPYEGDVIHEGRWGQSIRFGSTVKGETNWSATGENGDPITIVRNGQHEDGKDPWIPQVEDINKDKSSVYLTSTQAIPIEVASKDYKSYKTSPISPSKYTNEQIVLNSSRLLFNSKSDSILMSSAKSISLNSIESVNIDSPTTTINSKEIYLGDKSASESVILGDKFLTDMSKLLTQIIALGTALQTPIGTPVPGVPNAAIPIPATQLVEMAKKMFNNVQTYKSKVTKTK
ncbi:hypothetical protein N9P60_00430 [bacterium]|nr:hypothetical protein [bacterium]MDB4319895.1 hypothetical protein [bacterium]MDB9992628.1 hypothetical protein [bacterium]